MNRPNNPAEKVSINSPCPKAKIPAPTKNLSPQNENLLHRFVKEEVVSWGDVSFHLEERITEVKDLLELKPELKSRSDTISTIINDRGYLLSVLPLNLLMPEEVLIQFLPPEDFSVPHPTKHVDPYGINSSGACCDRSAARLQKSGMSRQSARLRPKGSRDSPRRGFTGGTHTQGTPSNRGLRRATRHRVPPGAGRRLRNIHLGPLLPAPAAGMSVATIRVPYLPRQR